MLTESERALVEAFKRDLPEILEGRDPLTKIGPLLAIDPEEMIRLYVEEELSTHAIGARYRCSHAKVAGILEENGVPRRSYSEAIRLANTRKPDHA